MLASIGTQSQVYAPLDYYLVDSLVIENFSTDDKELLESSLKQFHNAKTDSLKIVSLSDICENMMHQDWEKFQLFQFKLIQNALLKTNSKMKEAFLMEMAAVASNNIGFIYSSHGKYDIAHGYYNKALELYTKLEDKKGIATSLRNIGLAYDNQGAVSNALTYYFKSLKISDELKDNAGVAVCYNNIAYIYSSQGDTSQALEYLLRSLKIREIIGDQKMISNGYNSLGFLYDTKGALTLALNYFEKSLSIREKEGDKNGVSTCLNNIGGIYKKQAEIVGTPNRKRDSLWKIAHKYYLESIEIKQQINDKQGITFCLHNIGSIELNRNNLLEAQIALERSLKLAREIGFPESIKTASGLLSKVYEKQGKSAPALDMFKLYIQMRDSVSNEETQRIAVRKQAKYEYESQKALDDAKNEKLVAVEKEAKEKQKIITYAIGTGLGLVALFSFFVFNRLRVTRRQKMQIESQKKEVEEQKLIVEKAHSLLEEKQKEILDSIHYAKRIQQSLLPTEKYIERNVNKLKTKK